MGGTGDQVTARPQEGDWTCATHGLIQPRMDTLVPSCPVCGAGALRATFDRRVRYLVRVVPQPQRCSRGHELRPGQVLLGWTACACPPVRAAGTGGHRSWRCTARVADGPYGECWDVLLWPPHQDDESS